MNAIERKVYDAIKRWPALKDSIVWMYQAANAVIPVRTASEPAGLRTFPGLFFGFHDKCPWSADGRSLLAHRYSRDCTVARGEPVEVGILPSRDGDASEFEPLANTMAWNWQQGAMLQWVGATNSVVYNALDGSREIARILTVGDRGSQSDLEFPISSVSPDGQLATSFSFARLGHAMPGYGYPGLERGASMELCPVGEEGELRVFEPLTGNVIRSLDIAEFAHWDADPGMDGAFHIFTHTQFSKSSGKLLFFHRWQKGADRPGTRLYALDLPDGRPVRMETSGMVSHVAWYGDEAILGYASVKGRDGYYFFDPATGRCLTSFVSNLTVDGHPQVAPDLQSVVTDSYPDRKRIQRLFKCDVNRGKVDLLFEARIPFRYRGIVRADFHPRWNREGTEICFDSAHTGRRSLCVLPVGL